VPFGQGFGAMAPAYDAFETPGPRRQPGSDLGSNLALEMDASGNRKPSKSKAYERIEPAVAGIMAVSLHARTSPTTTATSRSSA
jgi:hypothetical protein